MPLHSWLPRAHPLAPANVSALMSGVMIKLALYGLIRVLFTWDRPVPLWVGLTLLALGALSAVGGVLYALFQHELKRLLAFHSIENVGIIVLGLGASLVFASLGRWQWSAIAFAAALLHTLNHAVFKALLFLGAGSFSAAVGALELDRLGGLVAADAVDGRRVRGRRDGDRRPAAAERVRVGVDDAPVAAARRRVRAVRRVARRGARDRGAGRDRGARGVLLREGDRSGAARRAAAPGDRERGRDAGGDAWAARRSWPGCASLLGVVPGLLVPTLAQLGPGAVALSRGATVALPGTGGLPTLALAVGLAAAGWWPVACCPRSPRGAESGVGVRPARRARDGVDVSRVHQAAAAVPRGGAAARAAS